MESIDKFVEKCRLEKYNGEQEKAEAALHIVEHLITTDKWECVRDLLNSLSSLGTILQAKVPWETTPFNMIQRVIKIIKDEVNTLLYSDGSVPLHSFSSMMGEAPSIDATSTDANVDCKKLKDNILEVLREQKAEIEQCPELISMQGETKIHNDETILTCGFCPNVLGLLLKASKKRRFNVIVAESAPACEGEMMANELSSSNIQTTLIEDCAVFALMSRVNKVIIGCKVVLCNGGIKAIPGSTLLACSAKYYSVPLYVCAATYKFSPEMAKDISHYDDPSKACRDNDLPLIENVNTSVAKFDYIPPENVTSFITNNRGIAPSYVYREVIELYHPAMEDI